MTNFIPYGKQYIDNDDIQEVTNALKSDFLTSGPYVEKFENKLSEVTSAKFSIACSSGTTALHLSLLALGIGAGDAVIVPTVTFLASANAARYCGAEVVFSDVDCNTGLITYDSLIEAYKKSNGNIKAVIVVHLCGQLADMVKIKEFCDKKNIKIVEDSCHAIGGEGVGNCSYSDMSIFSFHPVKTIAMGEGGAITTNSPVYAKAMKSLRCHSIARGEHWKYSMPTLGYNYRASDIHCALGYSQLNKLDDFVARRREIAITYQEFFSKISWAKPVISEIKEEAYHLYPILINWEKLKTKREDFMNYLSSKGIGTQVHYIPVHSQPYYGGVMSDLPNAQSFYEKVLSLPIFYSLSDKELEYILGVLNDY